MPLTPGDKLGPYEIVPPIGVGGMGEVYKARDTRLDRTVAIKVLPEHIAKRDDLRARFEREARAVASLNHPNICVLHDIGSESGIGYMVMEFMEGETLAERIAKGPIPIDQALKQATQIADALDRAHRAGVTHRDIKPQNIILTRDGVKVLDFGLAKSATSAAPSDATLTKVLTTEGTVMGTPQYMAPEQFEGKEADARSDIWAFGAVLYEMLTGQKAFQGKSYSSLVGAILSADPRPMAVNPFTPAWLEQLVRRCLNKDPERRYQSIRDIVLDLETPPQESPAARSQTRWSWAVATVCLVAAIAGWGAWIRKPNAPALLVKFDVNPPDGTNFSTIFSAAGSAISPDGRTLAFVATNTKGESLLHVRPLDSIEARALPRTEDAGRPFWSPDSKTLAFVVGGKLKRIDIGGGDPITLCDARVGRGGSWNENGLILFGDQLMGVQRISASGGSPSPVTQFNHEAGDQAHYYPQFLPGGNEFLYYVRHRLSEKSGIFVATLDGKPATRILQTEHRAAHDAVTGRLLYIQGNGTLMARRLESDPPRLTGDPVVVAEDISLASNNAFADFSISGTGALFYRQVRKLNGRMRFRWWDRAGKLLETIGQPVENGGQFRMSADGSRVAYNAGASPQDIWVIELARGLSTRITFSTAQGVRWSPDGKHLYYVNVGGIHRKPSDGSGQEELVRKGSITDSVQSISPDGKYLLFGNTDITTLPLNGEKPEPYLQNKHAEFGATFSPDGRWVAYVSSESGWREIYVQGFPDRRGKWLVSSAAGSSPYWRADGKELYWITPDNTLMAATMELQTAGVRVGQPEALFKLPSPRFQPARDGRRFIVLEPEGGQQPDRPMVVIQNWAAGLAK